MLAEDILKHPAKVLSQAERERYFETGYLLLESFISEQWLARLEEVSEAFVDESRAWTESDRKFDLEPGHSAENPRLRRLTAPADHHPVFHEFATQGPILDLAEDLLGPDLRFHHSKLNFKWRGGGQEVKWHQDVQFYPHTNYSVAAFGLYMSDVDDDMGPMGVVPGSHNGELFNQYNDQDQWVGAIDAKDLPRAHVETADYLKGPRGSVTVHNCRAVHGSSPNNSERGRPLLLHTYSSADALTCTPHPSPSVLAGKIVRGKPPRMIHFDPRPCPVPPDFAAGYTSIFAAQSGESAPARAADE